MFCAVHAAGMSVCGTNSQTAHEEGDTGSTSGLCGGVFACHSLLVRCSLSFQMYIMKQTKGKLSASCPSLLCLTDPP